MIKWKLVTKQISELKIYHKNPRIHTEKGMNDLNNSISKFGLPDKIIINTDNIIIGGHARYYTLKKQSIKETECFIPERKLTKKEVEELNIRLNKNIVGQFDFDILTNQFEFDNLLDWGFEENELGVFNNVEIKEKEIDENDLEIKNKCPSCGYEW